MMTRLQPDEPVLITAYDRLHRVGFVVSILDGGGVVVQTTAFDGNPLQYPGEARHSVLEPNVVRLRDLPSRRDVGGVVLEQSGGGGVLAGQLIAQAADGLWNATVGLYVPDRVTGARQSIDLAEWRTPGEIADAIDSQR